jgi:hypothetical protein
MTDAASPPKAKRKGAYSAGPGRPPGSKNKKTLALEEATRRAAASIDGAFEGQVRRAFRNLIGNVSLGPKSARDCVGRFYHRLNDDYQPMHGLARFLIEHSGPSAHAGEHEFLPFAVEMPTLFEAFVAEWLK